MVHFLTIPYFALISQELQNQGGMDKKINLSDLYIPTPEVFLVDAAQHYKALYKGEYKVPRQYIHVQVRHKLRFQNTYDAKIARV